MLLPSALYILEESQHFVTLFWGGPKITADGDSSHEIKRHLLLGRKVMTNLDSIFKSRDIALPTKVRLVKAMVITFLPRRKRLLISWLQSPSAVILEPRHQQRHDLHQRNQGQRCHRRRQGRCRRCRNSRQVLRLKAKNQPRRFRGRLVSFRVHTLSSHFWSSGS